MPLILERARVLEVMAEAQARGWVVPAFGVENQTTMEAVLAAAVERGRELSGAALPVILAVTNNYPPRAQTTYYTHSRSWRVGLNLFLSGAEALLDPASPYADVRVLLHLDHGQPDLDRELLEGGWERFSSIMFDASALRFEENVRATREFVERCGSRVVVEGACEEVGHGGGHFSDPSVVEDFFQRTGVDWVVPNLGTEHRADSSALRYEKEAARAMNRRIGARLVLHGVSSVAPSVLGELSGDGICKANVWTALERDSAPVLLEAMTTYAGKVAGAAVAQRLQANGLLGAAAGTGAGADLAVFPTAWRQQIVFEEMKRIAATYLRAWFPN